MSFMTDTLDTKKTYKSLTCRFLYCYCLFLSRPFSGEIGIRTPGTSQFNGFQDRRNRPLCHLSLNKSPGLDSEYYSAAGVASSATGAASSTAGAAAAAISA